MSGRAREQRRERKEQEQGAHVSVGGEEEHKRKNIQILTKHFFW